MSDILRWLKDRVPVALRRAARSGFSRLRHFGFRRFCPICRSRLRRFHPYGLVRREEALCPICGSLERHRMIWLYLRDRTPLFAPPRKRLLHVAPEPFFADVFRRHPQLEYVSADMSSAQAMVRLDLTRMALGPGTVDVIYCSHVLEHVPNDRRAMSELFRVLRPGQWAILQVPVIREQTYEDWSITTPEGREKAFGQHDHVRAYGKDYRDRLEAAGFQVTVDPFARELPERESSRMGIYVNEEVYLCRRPAGLRP